MEKKVYCSVFYPVNDNLEEVYLEDEEDLESFKILQGSIVEIIKIEGNYATIMDNKKNIEQTHVSHLKELRVPNFVSVVFSLKEPGLNHVSQIFTNHTRLNNSELILKLKHLSWRDYEEFPQGTWYSQIPGNSFISDIVLGISTKGVIPTRYKMSDITEVIKLK